MTRCPECKNEFLQQFVCTTCGAQKLYDATLASLRQETDEMRAEFDALAVVVRSIANANRWDREVFDGDDAFVAWAQSLCKHAMRTEAARLAEGQP